jgi:hypothetical protein
MRIVLGILLVVIGAAFPMAAVFWLNQRMSRRPAMTSTQVGLTLAFNGILPVSLILAGVGLLVPRLGARTDLQVGTGVAALTAIYLLVRLLRSRPVAKDDGPVAGDRRSEDAG